MENKKATLTMCILAKSDICAMTTACLFQTMANRELNTLVNICQKFCIGQSDLPKVRSEQASNWHAEAKMGDIFMFIDSDQTFTLQDIFRSFFYLEKADIVCGAYSRKDGSATVEPKNIVDFYKNKEGELWYGSTGFMMMTYDIVDRLVKHLKKPVNTSITADAYPLFYERIVEEPELDRDELWLGEDYSFCWLARQHGGKVWGYISPSIGHILPTLRFVTMPSRITWPDKSIAVYCGKTAEQWSPKNMEKGIGGSELAIIKLSQCWTQLGYSVTVYCTCDSPGDYDGVKYLQETSFSPTDEYNIVIMWRCLELLNHLQINTKKYILDLHDLVKPKQFTPRVVSNIGKICVKSRYHASLLGASVPENKIAIIPNGGAYEMDIKAEKDVNYLIYSSSYDRGLAYMLKWGWPRIKKTCPNAYLNIYYGWDGFDAVQPKTKETKLYKDTILELMKQEGVKECGRVPQKELLKEKAKANIHYYVGDFQEIDCISVRESACMGAIPVVSQEVQVFNEKPYCITIEGDPHDQKTHEKAADRIVELLQNPELAEYIRGSMSVPKDETWEQTALKWVNIFTEK